MIVANIINCAIIGVFKYKGEQRLCPCVPYYSSFNGLGRELKFHMYQCEKIAKFFVRNYLNK